jgi:Zn finger protein HypA/HybF involved in hydrogenase expression
MASSCPHCGGSVEYSEAEARLLTATCDGCGKSLTVVSGVGVVPGDGTVAPAGAVGTPAAPTPPAGLACAECGGPLTLELSDDEELTVECPACATTVTFVRAGPDDEEEDDESDEDDDRPRPARPPMRPPGRQGWSGPPDRGRGGDFDRPRARPCRQCGAPLTFSTSEDGSLVGECEACGNRFTLPRRTDGGGRGGPPGRGGGYGRPRGRPPGNRRPYGGSGRNYRPRNRDDRSDERNRRGRRRDSD